ncbi:ankyrin repeat [Fusarium phyllophilum]|uniref:Ankyrin repeat n=1 Tax=Fusarium phyllophilum TaxID=47803 RepID=A0A8H5K9L7_9HYPO|nr:ankyrin repeat [Fusarium phyllophilum]
MLNKLQGKALGCGEVTRFFLNISGDFVFEGTTRLESLSAIIDQKDIRHQNRAPLLSQPRRTIRKRNCTPLFVAVELGATEVFELLIGRGAHVDMMSTAPHGLLDVAFVQKSWRMVDTLLDAGLSSKRINVDGRNLLGLMTLWTCQPGTKPNIGLFKRLLDHGVDLYLNSWPDHFFSNGVDTLVAIAYSLRYVKPLIKIEGVRKLCGLETPSTHSLLCRAACWGSVTTIQNLIKLGISDLEHHFREHGSPLNAAIQSHRWETVKFLMLHGAKVPEDLLETQESDSQHTERKRNFLDLRNNEPKMKCWSGVWVVRVPLQWRDRKCSVESILEYAKRRHWIEIDYKSSAIRDTQLVRPKERRGSMSSVERQGYC